MKRKPDEPKGSPAWMNTFADLMNLLLCFFVLLFSMSTVDAEKFEKMVASFQNTFSILPNGGSSIGDGTLISSGVSQLEMLDWKNQKKCLNSWRMPLQDMESRIRWKLISMHSMSCSI